MLTFRKPGLIVPDAVSSESFAPSRRGFLAGLAAVIAAPAIVRADSLMKVRSFEPDMMQALETCMTKLRLYVESVMLHGNAAGLTATVVARDAEFSCHSPVEAAGSYRALAIMSRTYTFDVAPGTAELLRVGDAIAVNIDTAEVTDVGRQFSHEWLK